MDVPLQPLNPGLYLSQVNIIDDVSGTFAFPRFPVLIREAQSLAATKAGKQTPAVRTFTCSSTCHLERSEGSALALQSFSTPLGVLPDSKFRYHLNSFQVAFSVNIVPAKSVSTLLLAR